MKRLLGDQTRRAVAVLGALFGALLGALLWATLTSPPAQAAIHYVVSWGDPAGDAPGAADITKVAQLDDTTTRATVPHLGRSGVYRVRSSTGSERTVAVVSKRIGEAPRSAFKYSERRGDGSWGPWLPLECATRGTWDQSTGVVAVRIGSSCRERFGYTDLSTSVSLEVGDAFDYVATPAREGIQLGSETYGDAVGDAAPRADLRSAGLTYTEGALWARAHLTNLRDSGRFRVFLGIDRSWDGRVVLTKAAGQEPVATLIVREINYEESYIGPYHRVPCSMVVEWDPDGDVVGVQVPRRCYDGLKGAWWGPSLGDFTADNADDTIGFWK